MRLIKVFIISLVLIFVSCKKDNVKSTLRLSKSLVKISKQTTKLLVKNKEIKSWSIKDNFKLLPHKNKDIVSILGNNDEVLGKIIKVEGKTVVTTFSLTAKKAVNPLLDKAALPNTIYKVDSQIFKTDYLGRTISANMPSIPSSFVNRYDVSKRYEQLKALNKGGLKVVDHGGHLIGHSLGGNSGSINIVPQFGKLNKGSYSSIEKFVGINKKFTKNYNIKVYYKGKSHRPDRFMQSFDFYGEEKLLRQLSLKHENFKFVKLTDAVGKNYNRVVILNSNTPTS